MKLFVSKQLSPAWRLASGVCGLLALGCAWMASNLPSDIGTQFDTSTLTVVACCGVAMLGAAIAGKAPI